MYRIVLFYFGWEKLVSILSRKIYAACSSEIFLSEILVENQNCTISVGIFSVYISKGFIPFRNRVIPNATHWILVGLMIDIVNPSTVCHTVTIKIDLGKGSK